MTVITDYEVLELLADDPELLAIADAVAAARPAVRRRLPRRSLAFVGVAAAILAVALVSPWQRPRATIVDRALAAIGQAPVLHAVTRQVSPTGTVLVELATGRREAEQRVDETETWYDKARGFEHTITRTNGAVTGDVLQTPEGVTSEAGPVYTCAWIARHPVEATRERVSCRFDGNNGTTPRNVPEPPPVVDPALGGFATGYREALASGDATKVGAGELNGRHVYWLEIDLNLPVDPSAPAQGRAQQSERVAVDAETYKPVLVRMFLNGSPATSYDVLRIETLAAGEGDFTKPTLQPAEKLVSAGSVVDPHEIPAGEVASVIGRRGFWLGPGFDGLKLTAVERVTLRTGYSKVAALPPRDDPGIRLVYGHRDSGGASLTIYEATQPEYGLGWSVGRFPNGKLEPGFMRLLFFGGYVLRDGVYISISAREPESTIVAAARALEPMP